jgi:citrate lyase subunit beta/citryl-CoA lyase
VPPHRLHAAANARNHLHLKALAVRSLILAPADEKPMAEAFASGADALIIDLAVRPPGELAAAREAAARFLKQARASGGGGPALAVRVSPLDSGETDAELDAVMPWAPDVIVLPRSFGGASVQHLSTKLAVREAEFALADGATRIVAVADTARSLLEMASYRNSSARLIGLAWSAEDIRADIGAERCRDGNGAYANLYRTARDITLLAATAACIAAIDAAYPGDDPMTLRREAEAARRDGFLGMLALDPDQARIINEAFGPPREHGRRSQAR